MTPGIRDSIIKMIAEKFPSLVYGYPRTYIVAAVRADKRIDLVPPADASYLPELDAVEQWGLGLVTPTVGSEVCVVFRDANPARYVVLPLEFASTPTDYELTTDATMVLDSALIKVGDGAALGGARLTDPVTVTLPVTTITGKITALPTIPTAVDCTIAVTGWGPATAPGTITGASSKVLVE